MSPPNLNDTKHEDPKYKDTKHKTIIIDDAVPYAHEIFSTLGKVITVPGRDINAATVKKADALIVRSRTQVTETLLAGSSIKFVGSTVVGLDHIDQAYLADNGIQFYSAQGCNANSVAEFIITALVDLAEHLQFDLSTKRIGIIGVGHVGSLVQKKALALGMTCLLNDPPRQRAQQSHKNSSSQSDVDLDSFVDLNTCLTADIITVHTPLTKTGQDKTFDLLSAKRLQNIKPNQIIINAARGGIINEAAWTKTPTLANIIDCWQNEPHISTALYQTAYLATPHIAGHSLEAKVAGSKMVYESLCQFWGAPPQSAWQTLLPRLPETITPQTGLSDQATLNIILKTTHDIHRDDQAIRSQNPAELEKKYEHYRRNFPIYREWRQHRIALKNRPLLSNRLKNLGFTLAC